MIMHVARLEFLVGAEEPAFVQQREHHLQEYLGGALRVGEPQRAAIDLLAKIGGHFTIDAALVTFPHTRSKIGKPVCLRGDQPEEGSGVRIAGALVNGLADPLQCSAEVPIGRVPPWPIP